jgi:hypothetical protein
MVMSTVLGGLAARGRLRGPMKKMSLRLHRTLI